MTNVIKNYVQNKQDTLYNKTQLEKSKATSSKEISNPIHTILKTNTYLKSKRVEIFSRQTHILYVEQNPSIAFLKIYKSYKIC